MKARVLFLCTGNSARSQMAEGWLRHLAGDRFEVFSAGTHPVGLNPGSVDAMAEVGIDISAHRSKQVSEFLTQPFDHVITVCDRARESCPRWPGTTHLLHWSFDDPAAATDSDATRRQLFQRVRDEILGQIKGFLNQEGQPLASGPR
ncbi:MAG: arsenate reductase ArsC [Nitrospira sp.]